MSDRVIGTVDDDGVVLSGLGTALTQIPQECQYVNGDICCDYLMMYSLEMNPMEIIKWRLKKCLT
jgi:hypothetical protein